MAVAIGVGISLGYALAGQLPGGTVVADALLRGVAVGLTSAGAIATIRRLVRDNEAGLGGGRGEGRTATGLPDPRRPETDSPNAWQRRDACILSPAWYRHAGVHGAP